ncbi:MAG: hypothetical protein E6248_13055 [Clostridium sp.]|uniref:hypothetical protein n=1 Tax=Clostridium TaxID=1485 RepID=UPI002912020F|nr:hypothetical protein [Clostridium sp.]MDU5111368.1 hypothetical protein [Clostridium sp.]
MYDCMQRINIKNLTKDTLTNIELTHDGEGAYKKAKVKRLEKNENIEVSLYTLKVHNTCNLILTYTYKDLSNTVVVYDKLSGKDLTFITVEIKEEAGKISFNVIADNELWKY